MKDERQADTKERSDERRRFLGLLGTAGVLGLLLPFRQEPRRPQELSLKEADFYRDHDLAG
jgi:hypothetical protein